MGGPGVNQGLIMRIMFTTLECLVTLGGLVWGGNIHHVDASCMWMQAVCSSPPGDYKLQFSALGREVRW